MKLRLLLILPLFLLFAASSRADTTAPMFAGSSIIIPGIGTYTWNHATEDATRHYDTYNLGRATVTVTGMIGFPNLATVIGVSIDGFLQNGVYGNRVQASTSGVTLTFNGRNYTSVTTTTTYAVSLAAGEVTSSIQANYSGSGGNFDVAADGTISGTESGCFVDGNWYVNTPVYPPTSTDLTLPNGHHYSLYTVAYGQNNGQVVSTEKYYHDSSSDFNYYDLLVGPDGILEGDESGYKIDGTWYVNGDVETQINYTSPDGRNYTRHYFNTFYTRGANGSVVANMLFDHYYDATGTLSFSIGTDGTISGSETGVEINGVLYVNSANAPATLMVGSNLWRYTGQGPNDTSLYQGMTTGQQLTLGAPDPNNADGNRVVTITDSTTGLVTATGTFNDIRGSARLSDGSELYSGDNAGQQFNPALNASNLHTIAADLDITGNVITFGALSDNTATAGVTLEFQDVAVEGGSFMATFHSMLSRPQAQWQWARATDSSGQTTLPVMKLDADSKLMLYDPTDFSTATVKLIPQKDQVSELPQLKLTQQTTLAENGSVVTRSLGDERYLRTSGGSQNLGLTGGVNINIGSSDTANTVPADSYAAVIGQNLNASSGQIVVGRNNTAVNDQIFVVGAGASTTETKNAFSVSTSGDTAVTGGMSVTGTTSLTNATVSGTLKVSGQDVLTKGQPLRVFPAGDLPMSDDFKATPPGVTAPTAP